MHFVFAMSPGDYPTFWYFILSFALFHNCILSLLCLPVTIPPLDWLNQKIYFFLNSKFFFLIQSYKVNNLCLKSNYCITYMKKLCQIFLYFNDLYFKIRLCKPILRLRGLAWAGAVAVFGCWTSKEMRLWHIRIEGDNATEISAAFHFV